MVLDLSLGVLGLATCAYDFNPFVLVVSLVFIAGGLLKLHYMGSAKGEL